MLQITICDDSFEYDGIEGVNCYTAGKEALAINCEYCDSIPTIESFCEPTPCNVGIDYEDSSRDKICSGCDGGELEILADTNEKDRTIKCNKQGGRDDPNPKEFKCEYRCDVTTTERPPTTTTEDLTGKC